VNLRFYKIRPDAKPPERAHPTDAGMDIFYCSNGNNIGKLYNTKDFWIPQGVSRLLPTGIKVEVPKGHMLEVKNKSGIASKKQLLIGACVIDPGYDGEIYINLHNVGTKTQVIKPGEKIAQVILVPVVYCEPEEVLEDTLNMDSERGEGAFGSTGRW
jgi:dUTP pyrophosphatase